MDLKRQLREGYTVFFRCGGRAVVSHFFHDQLCGKDSDGKPHYGQLIAFEQDGLNPAHAYRNDGSYCNYPRGDHKHPFDIVEIKSNVLKIVGRQ